MPSSPESALLAFKGSSDVVNITKREKGVGEDSDEEFHFLVFGRDKRRRISLFSFWQAQSPRMGETKSEKGCFLNTSCPWIELGLD